MATALLINIKDGTDEWGGRTRVVSADLALDDDYPTGGYPLPITKFGMRRVWNVMVGMAGVAAAGAYTYFYDIPHQKLMVFTAGVEVGSSGDLSAVTALRITMVGR